MKELLGHIMGGLEIAGLLYVIPYLIRKGWGDAENRTKKVCDICFRDIKKWTEAVKNELKNP